MASSAPNNAFTSLFRPTKSSSRTASRCRVRAGGSWPAQFHGQLTLGERTPTPEAMLAARRHPMPLPLPTAGQMQQRRG